MKHTKRFLRSKRYLRCVRGPVVEHRVYWVATNGVHEFGALGHRLITQDVDPAAFRLPWWSCVRLSDFSYGGIQRSAHP